MTALRSPGDVCHMMNYTDRLTVLMQDVVSRVPALSFIDMGDVLVFASCPPENAQEVEEVALRQMDELIDSITPEDTVRFGLRQTLQTRRDGQAWNLIDVTGWTDWEIEKSTEQTDFSNLFGTMELRPYAWLSLDTFGRYDFHDDVLREFNAEMRVIDADRWSLGLGTRYLKNDSNLVSIDETKDAVGIPVNGRLD